MSELRHLAVLFRFEGYVGGIVLFALANFGIVKIGAVEEIGFRRPGIRAVTVTPVSSNSLRRASEKDNRKALVAL